MTNFAPVDPEFATGNAAELLAQVRKSLGPFSAPIERRA